MSSSVESKYNLTLPLLFCTTFILGFYFILKNRIQKHITYLLSFNVGGILSERVRDETGKPPRENFVVAFGNRTRVSSCL